MVMFNLIATKTNDTSMTNKEWKNNHLLQITKVLRNKLDTVVRSLDKIRTEKPTSNPRTQCHNIPKACYLCQFLLLLDRNERLALMRLILPNPHRLLTPVNSIVVSCHPHIILDLSIPSQIYFLIMVSLPLSQHPIWIFWELFLSTPTLSSATLHN